MADHTADWHKNLESLGRGSVFDNPLYCLEVLDLSDNNLGGDIGMVLTELFAHGEVELRLSGNNFSNWLEDDPESVTLEDATSELVDAIEKQTGVDDIDATKAAGVGMKILRYTAKSTPAKFLARTGGGISILNAALGHEDVTEALIKLIFEDSEAACNRVLSRVDGGEGYCRTGYISNIDEPKSFWDNACHLNPCDQGCPNRPLGCRN